jgi:hypothetical protein
MDNRNEPITHLSIPERRLPILIAASPDNADGLVSFAPWNVRQISPNILGVLSDSAERARMEKLYGTLAERDRDRLLELLELMERIGAGDWSPVREFKTSVDRKRVGRTVEIQILGSGSIKSPVLLLTKAMTDGLSKSRFVVWWAELGQRFAPGIYCEDFTTALYAAVLWSVGKPGGLGVCRHCGQPFFRSRSKKRYCSHSCQSAAGMRRFRSRHKKTAKSKLRSRKKTGKDPSKRRK